MFLANNGSWYQVDIQCILKEFILSQRQVSFSVIITLWKSKQSTVSLLSSSCIVDFCELTVFLLFWLFYCVSNDKRMTSIKCKSTNLELTEAITCLIKLLQVGALSLFPILPHSQVSQNSRQPLHSRAHWNYSKLENLGPLPWFPFAFTMESPVQSLVHVFLLLFLPPDWFWCFPMWSRMAWYAPSSWKLGTKTEN